jgi:hypothetical protein
MANDIAYGLVLLAFVGAIVAYVYWPRPPRTIVRERTGPTTVLVEPALTPLRDSGPANNTRRRTVRQPGQTASRAGTRRPASRGSGGSQAAPVTLPTRSGTRKRAQKRKPAASPSKPAASPQPAQPPPSTSPPPSVSVPLPSVCVPPVRVGNCP